MVVVTQCSGSSSSLGVDVEPNYKRMHEFITSEITHDILDVIHVMFGMIKEGIMEILNEWLGAFHIEMAAGRFGVQSLTFREFKTYGALELFGKKDPIVSRQWIMDIESTQQTSYCPERSRVRFSSCLLSDRARDWWDEVVHALGAEVMEDMK